jgi:hypothetical protein
MPVQKHQAGIDHAQSLIDKSQYVKDSDWSDAQPSTDDENAYIDEHGWEAFGAWHLAVDTAENEETKARYKFPYGDFRRVHRSALVAAKQRAGSEHYGSIEDAAGDLLGQVPEP